MSGGADSTIQAAPAMSAIVGVQNLEGPQGVSNREPQVYYTKEEQSVNE